MDIVLFQVLGNGEPLVSMADLRQMASVYLESPATRTLQEIKCEGKGVWEFTRVFREEHGRQIVTDQEERQRKRNIRMGNMGNDR
jgi:hypothetical protein